MEPAHLENAKKRGLISTASLFEELSSYVTSKPPLKVKTVLIGQGFTAVRLESGEVGLALTPVTRFDTCIGASRLSGALARCDSRELARLFGPNQPAHLRSVGLATINAVCQREFPSRMEYSEGDFLDFLSIEPGERVAMIDYYTTRIESLKGSSLTIFDDRFAGKRKDVSILPMSKIPSGLKRADVVIVPPTKICELEDFRRLASRARDFVVVHPTTPPLPEPFFRRGVTMIGSFRILDHDAVFRHVMEGAGTTLFKKFCEKIVFMRN